MNNSDLVEMADFLAVLKDTRFYCQGGLPFSFHPVLDLGLHPSPDLGGQILLETNTPGGATWLPGPDFPASFLVSSNNTCQLTDRLYVTLSTVGFHKLPSSLLREHPFVPDCPMHANVPTDAAAGQTQVSFLLLHFVSLRVHLLNNQIRGVHRALIYGDRLLQESCLGPFPNVTQQGLV